MIISLASPLFIVIGWMLNGYLNRKKNAAEKKLEYRLAAAQAIFDVHSFISFESTVRHDEALSEQKINDFLLLLLKARDLVNIYCTEEEIDLFEIVYSLFIKKEYNEFGVKLSELVRAFRSSCRTDLGV
ncbi:MAG: hypothetical protein SNH79_07210 [Rikenellaceae bacterium]